jgi:regulator of protease activity HflC (stomatin/prohibitin superfamily)
VPSARRAPQIAVLALCGAVGAGSLGGCETTQEKASAQRAESARILEARAKRQAKRTHRKHGAEGTKSSARQSQPEGEG